MDSYNLTGTVTSNYTINYFKGRIINFATGKEVMEYHYNPNSTKVYIADSAVNQNLKFGNLSNGIYYLCYYAEDTSGAEYSWDSKSTPFGKGKATITWNANGGNASSASTTKLYCDKIGTLPTATRSGYSFDGWYTAASGGTKITTSTLVTGAATYYAHWTSVSYTVKYNQNVDNGKIMDIADQTKTKDQDLKLSTVVPARNGYTFAGWATSAGGSVTYKPGDTYKNNADVTLYAVWTKNAKSPEKVTYNGHTYQIFDFTAEGSWKTWDEAKAYCEAQGGHLAAITTSEEDLFLYDYIKKSGYNSVYFGLTNTSGSWKWVTGEAFSYCDWATGQPSGGTEHYGTYWWSLGGKWNDADGKTNKNVLAYLCEWDTAEYTNNIHLWASGFKNQEGNSNDKSALDIGTTAFTKSYQDKYVLTASYNKTEIPNGYYLDTTRWGSRQYTGDSSWKWYEMGKDEVTQPAQGAWIEYDCHPYEYSITYNLNGGTNNAENPAKYTVLYGVSFKDPSRDGYSFTGWTDGSGKKITGINEGQNASFASAEDMISKLKTRTTGNVTVTANWEKNSTVEPVPITITSIKCENGAVVLAWQPQSGVDGYRVHKKTGSGKWTTLVASTTATTYTDTAVTEGTTYTYTVRSFVGSEYSTGYNDTAKSIKVTSGTAAEPSPVAITSIKCVNGAVVLAWQPQSGVDGYRVHKKTGSGKWTTLVASTTAATYTDTAVTEGTTYTYTVRSFVGSEYSTGYNDTAKSIKVTGAAVEPSPVAITSIKCVNGAVVLAWQPQSGVDGYRVHKKTGSGKWTTLVASTTATAYTDTAVTEGTTYTYTVRSFVGSEYSTGYNDTAKSIKVTSGTSSEPPAVTISSIQSTGGMVVLSWNAAPGVDGYRVYRKTGSGKWTTVCASTTDTMFIDTNVTAGTTYTYTLRSFIGSTYSSGYNDTAKSIKAK
ncbi:MAG: InlB B-repeat-containing protein [Clostridia bacterium]|nr:InlB B-repeat-containing protein [Clostridia bacterium]